MSYVSVPGKARRAGKSMNGEKRQRVGVNATLDEYTLLKMKASKSGVSVSKLLLDSALRDSDATKLSVEDVTEVRDNLMVYRRQLIGMATNLNQLAHHTNATQEFSQNAAPLMGKINELIRQIAGFTSVIKER